MTNVWELLRNEVTEVAHERPENSVTAQEYAERRSCSVGHARDVLFALSKGENPVLRLVRYKTAAGRRGDAYVPLEVPNADATKARVVDVDSRGRARVRQPGLGSSRKASK